MDNVWLQLIISGGAVISGIFVTVKYAIAQSNKKERYFLDYLKDMESKQLEYYEAKNGHLERISKTFASAISKNTRSLDKLSASIKSHNSKSNG